MRSPLLGNTFYANTQKFYLNALILLKRSLGPTNEMFIILKNTLKENLYKNENHRSIHLYFVICAFLHDVDIITKFL